MSLESITDSLRDININRAEVEDPQYQPLLFHPPAGLEATNSSLSEIPTYLFRVASPKSSATTSSTWVRPPATRRNDNALSHEDIFTIRDPGDKKRKAALLNDHLWWQEPSDDPFVSWTSSLPFALQLIYYRHQSSRDGSPLREIRLYVVDTKKFPRGTFIRDVDLINAFVDVDPIPSGNGLKRLRRYRTWDLNFGEYLSQGALRIEGKCQMISGQSIFENNRLRRIQPNFTDIDVRVPEGNPRWAKEVCRLRRVIWRGNGGPLQVAAAVPHDRMQAVGEIADLFDHPAWRLPMAIYFAALVGSRQELATVTTTTTLLEALRPYYASSDIGLDRGDLKVKIVGFQSVPELEQTATIFQHIRKDYTLRKTLGFD
ncbi:uncharacterized protein BP01DRAFT_420281 [Aspergillus saccharolyticus JOP 1030-1]|uniref:DUF7587 domain-containing protein n=1 Tax=Aspergillus saccharolyticus JOP 1030-1 TaxID=1450539 RepID=A0A318ZNT4_9EURO|nr:hypothetical protein BP01DRAFT_420281 [Aspergillus saccharolyticus JOP 1030-1]PYH49259.1 hypothetical protein BP01DRAFT_420281 [Aspergillus saccharolyticus JOP 1030-1]